MKPVLEIRLTKIKIAKIDFFFSKRCTDGGFVVGVCVDEIPPCSRHNCLVFLLYRSLSARSESLLHSRMEVVVHRCVSTLHSRRPLLQVGLYFIGINFRGNKLSRSPRAKINFRREWAHSKI